MNKTNIKNVIILKNLPSNLIDEAIMVVKDKKKVKDIYSRDLIIDGGEKFSKNNKIKEKNKIIQSVMKEDDIKRIEQIKKNDKKYIIKEAEIVVMNYLDKLEKPISERKIRNMEKSYRRLKTINFALIAMTIISIIMAILL